MGPCEGYQFDLVDEQGNRAQVKLFLTGDRKCVTESDWALFAVVVGQTAPDAYAHKAKLGVGMELTTIEMGSTYVTHDFPTSEIRGETPVDVSYELGWSILPAPVKLAVAVLVSALLVVTPDTIHCTDEGRQWEPASTVHPNTSIEWFNGVALSIPGFAKEEADPNPSRPSHVRGWGMERVARESGLSREDIRQIVGNPSRVSGEWPSIEYYCGAALSTLPYEVTVFRRIVLTARPVTAC
jgi:hypothetical protein